MRLGHSTLLILSFAIGCGQPEEEPVSTGGGAGVAGTPAFGGSAGTNPVGVGGVAGTNPVGVGGTAGTNPVGGSAGTNPVGVGGVAGSAAGSAGTLGEAGAPSDGMITFDTGVEGFEIIGATPETLLTGATLEHDAVNGALLLTVPFSAPADKIEVGLNLATPVSVAGTVSAEVTLVSGLTSDPMLFGGSNVIVKTGTAYVYANSGYFPLEPGVTTKVTFNPAAPGFVDTAAGTLDMTDVRQIGFDIVVSETDMAANVSQAVVRIDNFSY